MENELINTSNMRTSVDFNFITGTVTKIIDDTTFNEEIKKLGWGNSVWGAEGEYLNKDEFRLQIINQSELRQSVINLNHGIKGTQNLCIFHVKNYTSTKPETFMQKMFFIKNKPKNYTDFETVFFGYCENVEEFKTICKFLGI